MKKIITVIAAALAVTLFSSCIMVGWEESGEFDPECTSKSTTSSGNTSKPSTNNTPASVAGKYTVTCYNNTSHIIYSWGVQKDNILTFANSTNNRMIASGGKDSIVNLEKGKYKILFCFTPCDSFQPITYTGSEEFDLSENITYILSEIEFPCYTAKSAVSAGYPALKLSGSDGTEVTLYPEE